MKYLYIITGLVVVVVVFLSVSSPSGSSDETTTGVAIEQAVASVNQDDVYVMDVRTVEEWQQSHASGAVWWGLAEKLEVGEMPDITVDSTIYVYCRSGNRSAVASRILRDNGFQDVQDIGAFSDWQAAGGQTASGEVVLP